MANAPSQLPDQKPDLKPDHKPIRKPKPDDPDYVPANTLNLTEEQMVQFKELLRISGMDSQQREKFIPAMRNILDVGINIITIEPVPIHKDEPAHKDEHKVEHKAK